MIGDLFGSDPLSDQIAGVFGLGTCAQPPDSVPLRILALDAIPLSRDTLKSVFRAKVMAAHPDLATYTVPHLRQAAEAAAAAKPDVQELIWARDVLMRRIPAPVTADQGVMDPGFSRNKYSCKACKDERRTSTGRLYPNYGDGRWAGYCYPCASDAENARQRELRAQARTDLKCEGCGTLFTPKRADGRYCSNACRQAMYRKRIRNDTA